MPRSPKRPEQQRLRDSREPSERANVATEEVSSRTSAPSKRRAAVKSRRESEIRSSRAPEQRLGEQQQVCGEWVPDEYRIAAAERLANSGRAPVSIIHSDDGGGVTFDASKLGGRHASR